MEISTPAFSEKEFLTCLLSVLEEKYGTELRFILDHSFSGIDVEIAQHLPTLNEHIDDVRIKKFISQWFEEAKTRGIVNRPTKDVSYCISLEGYQKAIRNKHRLKYFWNEHWKYIVTTSLAFAVAVIGVLRFIGC
jgi:hypothetical protein